MKTESVLPGTLSELLKVGLNDFDRCLDQEYLPDAMRWHISDSKGCSVCLGGAVIAQSLGAKPNETLTPIWMEAKGLISELDARRLESLDCLRTGRIGLAFRLMRGKYTWKAWKNADLSLALMKASAAYEASGVSDHKDFMDVHGAAKFVEKMREVASELEALGL